jgi:lipopolysaccharide biosynthesis protein
MEMREKIGALQTPGILLLCSLPDKFARLLPHQRENEKFVVAANVGKDIGGKLILMEMLSTLYPQIPYAILLHDKRSYQKQSGHWEKEGLFSIIEPKKFRSIAAAFDNDPRLGIACATGYIRNEYLGNGNFTTNNSDLLAGLMTRYALPDHDLRFVGGTMFWIRTSLLRKFFSPGQALAVRATLEAGNVLDHEHGTKTHCWERIFSWIATSADYKIKEF